MEKILGAQAPWYENAYSRLEIVNRIRFWRFLTGDEFFNVHYWLTRLENVPDLIA